MGYKRKSEFEDMMDLQGQDHADVIPIVANEDEDSLMNTEIPENLPVLPLRNTVLFPGVVMPLTVGRKKSKQLVEDVNNSSQLLGCVAQKDPEVDEPGENDLFSTGTLAKILKIIEMPDGTVSVIIQGLRRFEVVNFVKSAPYFVAETRELPEFKPFDQDSEFVALVSSLKEVSLQIVKLNHAIPHEVSFAIQNIQPYSFLINFICSNSDIKPQDKQDLLEIDDIKERGTKLLEILSKQIEHLRIKNEIEQKARKEISQQQKEFMLQQQMKTIQEELGGSPMEKELKDLKEKGKKKKWSKEIAKHFDKEANKLQFMNPAAGEYSVQLNYLQTMLDIPFNEFTDDKFDLKRAETVLNEDHYGLDKVKDRILEHLSVLKLKGDMKAPILCLVGPPGVGKTSLGKSVARSLDRKYIRMSLGGLRDESEIRGHRKTYIGAMPGRIIQNIKKAGSSNPVFILDEIDKVGNDFRGDPSSALLEVLDPEQNSEFHDNYLEVDYDLSHTMFIATANTVSTISPALRDRMEIIYISGYIPEEKKEIAKRHLIPRQLENPGLKKEQLSFTDNALVRVIEGFTKESGVRGLDKQLAKIIRRIARKVAMDEKVPSKVDEKQVKEILGHPKYIKEGYEGNELPGVVTGLAWTSVGGEILYIETSLSRGNGKLTITGNLGDVMKESATIALEYIKAHSEVLDINPKLFDYWNVHLHVPEGAIPKDGPSAGITMAVSMASAFTQRKVRKNTAMTGEITLRGRVMPVGGIKEKILAAKRSGISDILLSRRNEKDIMEVKDMYKKGLSFHYVDSILDVLEFALLKEKVKDARDISCPDNTTTDVKNSR
ncbi:MAG: endopeptidase La [Bacteroidota bacterium]